MTYAVLNPGDTVQFSIHTTVLEGAEVSNIACITAVNQVMAECATGSVIAHLPQTGETPLWRNWLWLLIVPIIGIGLLKRRLR